MTRTSHRFIRTSAIALAIAALSGPALAESKLSQDVTDARQETQIWTTYALSPYLRAMDIKVSVHNGKAVLTGKVDEDVNKELAKEIALGVDGIKEVDNQITVQADYMPAKKSDSYGDKIDDATITTAVKSKLMWNKHTDGLSIDVSTKAGKVTLKGMADSAESRDMAGRLAANTKGVQDVDNQMKLGDKSKDGIKVSADKANSAISDTWITTKVKSTFMYSSNVDSSDIEVNTRGGVVTLKGNVDSGAEQALAVELAQNIKGVKSVVSTGLAHR
jgi:hyperosmotically inducible periplasmic protein